MKSFILALIMFMVAALVAPLQDLAGLSHVMPVLPSLAPASATTASLTRRRGRDVGEYCGNNEGCQTKSCVNNVCLAFGPRRGQRWEGDKDAYDHGRMVFGRLEPVWANWEEYNAGKHRLLFPDGSKQECIKENDLCHVYGEYIVDNEFTIFPNGNQPDPFEGPGYQLTPVTPDPSPPQEYRPTIDEAKAAGINVGSGANQKRDASALPDDKESDHDTFAESFQDWEVMSTLVGWLNV